MAYLLGSKACIESLQNDVKDLHMAVIDVFSRVGPVRHPSWKYPDKMSCDIDIGEILEQHQFSPTDEEDSQVAHIVMLELVIERMVLLFQSMAKFVEQTLSVGRATSAMSSGSNLSVGLIVKKFWNKMVQINSMVTQLQSQTKSHQRRLSDIETNNEKLRSPEVAPVPNNNKFYNDIDLKRSSPVLPSISRDMSNKSSQTIETSFVPCDACARVQNHLYELGDNTVDTCKKFQIPSSLSKYRTQIASVDWLSANDVGRWVSEQNKDMSRISNHFEQILNTVEPLKSDLSRATAKIEHLEDLVQDHEKKVEIEKETQVVQRKQYENKLSDLESKKTEAVNQIKRKNDELQNSKKILDKQVTELKGELDKQITALKHLEIAQVDMIKDLQEKAKNKDKVDQIEAEKSKLLTQLSGVNSKMDSVQRELAVEKAKNESIERHSETLQVKQSSLVERLEELTQENTDLQEQAAELEDKCEELENQLEQLKPENETLRSEAKRDKTLIQELTNGKKALEESITALQGDIKDMESQMVKFHDQEQLLLAYPDLNGPITAETGTGDIAVDMENQVKANSLRIQLLEQENETLRNSITKMLSIQTHRRTISQQSELSSHGFGELSTVSESVPPPYNTPTTATRPPGGGLGAATGPVPLWRKDNLNKFNDAQNTHQYDDRSSVTQDKNVKAVWTANHRVQKMSSPSIKTKSETEEWVVSKPRPPSVNSTNKQRPASGKSQQTSNSSIAAYLKLKSSGKLKSNSKGSLPGSHGGKGDYTQQDVFMCAGCDKIYTNRKDLDIHKRYCTG